MTRDQSSLCVTKYISFHVFLLSSNVPCAMYPECASEHTLSENLLTDLIIARVAPQLNHRTMWHYVLKGRWRTRF